jgi:predicted GH43/DUF377 family glycosyl hydrolase
MIPMPRCPRRLAAVAILGHFALACHSMPAAGGIRFDFEPRVFAPLDHYVKDHTVLFADGRYHLVYTTGTDSLGRWMQPGNEVHFGHATSLDLRHWQVEAPILAGPRAPWEERNRWAPQLLRLEMGGYRLYYNGVNARIAQAVGIAEAASLDAGATHFAPLAENPVFHPDTAWARWDERQWSNGRDPQVLEHEGTWWMLLTATHKDGRGAVGLARSSDGVHWNDAGPLLLGAVDESIESPQMVHLGERWFLLFTSDRRGGTWVIEGPDLHGPWDFSQRRRWLDSVAPEVWSDGHDWWISTHQSYRLLRVPELNGRRLYLIGFDRLTMDDAGLAIVNESGLGADWPIVEGSAFSAQPTLGDNAAARGLPGAGPVGSGYLGSAERFTWPPERPGESLGHVATGRIRSRPFVLTGTTMSLLVGGTANIESTYVALIRRADGEVLFRETGRDSEKMDEREWAIRDLRGTEVEIEIADWDPHGRINVDEIVEHDSPPAAGATPRLLDGSPNPFRESISIRLAMTPNSAPNTVEIAIHDVHGRRVRTLHARTSGSATVATAIWDGRNEAGDAVAGGVYFARLMSGGREDVIRVVRIP